MEADGNTAFTFGGRFYGFDPDLNQITLETSPPSPPSYPPIVYNCVHHRFTAWEKLHNMTLREGVHISVLVGDRNGQRVQVHDFYVPKAASPQPSSSEYAVPPYKLDVAIDDVIASAGSLAIVERKDRYVIFDLTGHADENHFSSVAKSGNHN